MFSQRDPVIVAAARTPIGTFGGMFKTLHDTDLSVPVMKELVKKAKLDGQPIDDVIWGCCYQRTTREANLARVAAIKAGISVETPGVTLQRVCTSSLQAIVYASWAVRLGEADIVLAGGSESMSTVPYIIEDARWGLRIREQVIRDPMWDGLTLLGVGPAMGITAENVAEKYQISREEQDRLALSSHQRAIQAIKEGRFKDEMVPVPIPQKRGEAKMIDTDEHPRPEASLENLAKLPPAFKEGGTVTAGNSSGINDGAAGVVVMAGEKAEALGLKPMARIISSGISALDPAFMGISPVKAIQIALGKAGWTLGDVELVELNEAFAAQYLGCEKELGLNRAITNVNGSGIALGHPVGCSGARITTTLLYEMEKRGVKKGLASLCGGGGIGLAVLFERC
ncbi:MAG: thiolase family protein [Deltaproteobacteria bacterium]|nr:thiolase family protein [Deltaproteobacteria bacterium]